MRRHELTNPAREETSPFPEASSLALHVGGAAVAGANGCQWFNPFSNAIQRNAIDGQVNPQFNPAVANDPAVIKSMEDATPLKRVAEPAEMAGTVVFLASQHAGFITGATINATGGFLMY